MVKNAHNIAVGEERLFLTPEEYGKSKNIFVILAKIAIFSVWIGYLQETEHHP